MPKKRPELWALYLKCHRRSEDLIIYERLFDPALAALADIPEQQDMPNTIQDNVRQPDNTCDNVPVYEPVEDPEQAVLLDKFQVPV